jgi:hypothetical protein
MASYYLLPKGNIDLTNCFQLEYSENTPKNILSPSLTHYLNEMMSNTCLYTKTFYKLQNEVYPYYKNIISKNIFSVEFYELFEIIQIMHLNKYIETNIKSPLQILSFEKKANNASCLAFQHTKSNSYSSSPSTKDMYFSYWNYGIYNIQSFEKTYLNYAAKNHVIIINSVTNNKRYINNKIILIQICMAICNQAKKGIFIWKINDYYSQLFLEIMYLLSSFYEKTYVIKPSIIDTSKSEKYIVCKGFLYENSYSIYTYLYSFIKYMDTSNSFICRFLNINIPSFFISKLEEVNYILGQTQLEQIQYLLLLYHHKYKNEKMQNIMNMNEQKCSEWCRKFRYIMNYSMPSPSP